MKMIDLDLKLWYNAADEKLLSDQIVHISNWKVCIFNV